MFSKLIGSIVALVVALGIGFSPVAQAEALSSDLGGFVSYLDSDDLDAGYGGGVDLKINLVEAFSIDARASYLDFSDAEMSMIPLEVAALLNISLGEALGLYGGVGAGYYLFDADGIELDDAFGYFPVGGVEIGVGDLKLFGEVRWLLLTADVDAAGDEISDLLDGVEADVDGLGLNVGLSMEL